MTFFSHQSPRSSSKVLSKKCLWAAAQREGNAQTSWEKGKQIFPLHPFLNVTFPPSLQGGCSTRSNAVGAPGRMPRKRCVRATFYSKTSTDWSISTKLCVGAGQGDETDQNCPEYWEYFPVQSCEMGVEELSSVGNIFRFWINELDVKLGVLFFVRIPRFSSPYGTGGK